MALVNDYRPASKNNTEAVVVELDGRPHVFYVATRAIPANTEVREEERGAGGLTRGVERPLPSNHPRCGPFQLSTIPGAARQCNV